MKRKERVKSFFEKTKTYFYFDYNIKIREETIRSFLGENQFDHVLDMPCGNGAISLNNIDHFGRLVLVDFSENMISLAKEIAAEKNIKNVSFVCDDIFKANLEKEEFDLVISLGILAHVDDVDYFLNHIQERVRRGGMIIIQNTSSNHFYSKLIRLYLGIRWMLGKDKYKLNKVPSKQVERNFETAGFTCLDVFRYNQSFLGLSRLFSNEAKYRLTRKWFGSGVNNKNAWLGSDCIYLFQKN